MLKHHYRKTHPFPPGYPRRLDLITSFWMAAHWVWERRASAKRANMQFSEETITDTVLLDLATQHPKELKIIAFNKRQEGFTGADWEWCFYDRNQRFFQPMLVQAKLLDDKDEEYSHIDRKIGSTGIRQIDQLIETSNRLRVPAVFAFYNHLRDSGRVPSVCHSFQCAECWGCSVALAEAVRAVLPKKDFDTIRRHSKPWVCLLCRGMTTDSDAPFRVLTTLRDLYDRSVTLFREATIPFENTVRPPDLPSKEPPNYFRRLINLDEVDSIVERRSLIQEVATENPEIAGIVLATDHSAHHE